MCRPTSVRYSLIPPSNISILHNNYDTGVVGAYLLHRLYLRLTPNQKRLVATALSYHTTSLSRVQSDQWVEEIYASRRGVCVMTGAGGRAYFSSEGSFCLKTNTASCSPIWNLELGYSLGSQKVTAQPWLTSSPVNHGIFANDRKISLQVYIAQSETAGTILRLSL